MAHCYTDGGPLTFDMLPRELRVKCSEKMLQAGTRSNSTQGPLARYIDLSTPIHYAALEWTESGHVATVSDCDHSTRTSRT